MPSIVPVTPLLPAGTQPTAFGLSYNRQLPLLYHNAVRVRMVSARVMGNQGNFMFLVRIFTLPEWYQPV